jgi:hypothetical protein
LIFLVSRFLNVVIVQVRSICHSHIGFAVRLYPQASLISEPLTPGCQQSLVVQPSDKDVEGAKPLTILCLHANISLSTFGDVWNCK